MPSERYRRVADVAFRQVGDECLLVPIRTSPKQEMSVFAVNGVGAFVWQALAEQLSVDQLSARVAGEFEVEKAQAERDVEAFVKSLQSRKLVERVEG